MKQIIGICGFIGSGKDTMADILIAEHGFHRESYAGKLKDAIADIFGWDRELLEGKNKEGREWRERVDTWWSQRLDMPNLTPRWVLQQWGTEVCRQAFHDDIWIASLENKIRNSTSDIVISDCRFPNEIASIRRSGGKIIWVTRGKLPEWYECALHQNENEEDLWILEDHGQTMEQLFPNVHVSEWAWIGQKFDLVVENNGTLQDLRDTIKSRVLCLQEAKVI